MKEYLQQHIVHLINFTKHDKICQYLNEIGVDIDLLEDETELKRINIDRCDLSIFNYSPENELQSQYLRMLHCDSYSHKILVFAEIAEIDNLLEKFPNFEYLFKQLDLCQLNLKILYDKLKKNELQNKLSQTEQKADNLAAKLATYSKVMNSSPEAIILLDEDGTIIGANDYISNMMIKKLKDYEGRNIFELVSIGLCSLLTVNLKESSETGKAIDFIFKHHDYVTEYRIIPIAANGSSKQFILFTQNVTEKVYAEKALKFNSDLMNTIINNLPVTVWHIDHNMELILIAGKYFEADSPFADFQMGASINDVFRNYPEFLSNINNAFNRKITFSIDTINSLFLETYYSVVHDALGNIKGMIGLSNDITEKINAEIKLEEEKNKVRFAFQVSNDSFWEFDPQNQELSINSLDLKKGTIQIPEKISLNEFIELLYPDDRPYLIKLFFEFTDGSIDSSEFHYRIKSGDNSWIWIESKASVFEYDENTAMPKKIIGVSRDVTDKVNIERDIQMSRNLLETTINSGDHYFLLLDTDYNVLAFNNLIFDHLLSFLNIYVQKGIKFDKFFNHKAADIEFSKHFELALKDIGSKYEFNYVDYVGADYWLEHFIDPIRTIEGDIYAVNLLAKPINDRKLIEQALLDSRKTLEAILDTSPIGIVLTKNDKIQWTNRYWRELMRYPADSETTLTFCDFCVSKDRCFDCITFSHASQFNEEIGVEMQMTSLSGILIDCLVYAKYIRETDNYKEILITIVDITERKSEQIQREALLEANISAEKKRNEAISLIENSARIASIGVIAGGVTHEINQPLNAIRVASEGILFWNRNHNMALPDQVTRLINKISNATMKVDEIIQHMRAYWVESTKNISTNVYLIDSIHKALSLTLQRVQSHDVFLRIEEQAGNLFVEANPLQLEIIINNMVINALQSLDKTDIKNKAIVIKTGVYEDRPFLKVIDNGLGLPDVPVENLFDPFFSTKKEESGTGLGLAIVKLFATRFGAEVTAENNPDGGASFTIFFLQK